MLDDGAADGLGLHTIGAGSAAVEYAFGYVIEPQTDARCGGVRAGHDEQTVLVKFMIRNRNERVMPAAVVPPQHGLRKAARAAQPENALNVFSLGHAG